MSFFAAPAPAPTYAEEPGEYAYDGYEHAEQGYAPAPEVIEGAARDADLRAEMRI